MLPSRDSLHSESTHRQRDGKRHHVNGNEGKKARVAILVSDKTDFTRGAKTRDKGHFITTEGLNQQEDTALESV